jgi:hypothetical protein
VVLFAGGQAGGVLRPNDIYPFALTLRDSVMVENYARIGNSVGASIYNVMPDCAHDDNSACELVGSGNVEYTRCHFQG